MRWPTPMAAPRRRPIPGAGASPAIPRRAARHARQDGGAARRRSTRFVGTAAPGDFSVGGNAVSYSGPADWSYRRMVLHYAHLCAAAGGVDAFLIGSELRGLTTLRDGPAQLSLRRGAGAACRRGERDPARTRRSPMPPTGPSISATSRHDGTGDRVLPSRSALGRRRRSTSSASTTTCRCATGATATAHDDRLAGRRSTLRRRPISSANVAGGEGFDWYYASDAATGGAGSHADHGRRLRQALGVPLQGSCRAGGRMPHVNRPGGVERASPTAWVPRIEADLVHRGQAAPAIDKGRTSPMSSSMRNRRRAPAAAISPAAQRDDLMQNRM